MAGQACNLSCWRGLIVGGRRGVARGFAWANDRLNPILVKETRQALKSRQFVITFALLLMACWVWSVLGVMTAGQDVYYGTAGPTLFAGYFLILAFPLLVIVPFGAFRSLAIEQEDRTYEMLCVTALDPRQIVRGKLASAAMQMVIYLSAVAPCVAFTYMLRGISFPMILMLLVYVFLASLGLSMVGLLAGTLTTARHFQVVLSVLLIVGLLGAFWLACIPTFEVVQEDVPITNIYFWTANAAVLTFYLSYFALLYQAAAAQLTFASDNRSTRLRVVMLVQYLLIVGWMSWLWASERRDLGFLLGFSMVAGLHWYVMGAFLTGESPHLSLRVRRRLPRSFLGRAFLTWFNPGPGTGYLFAVCGLSTIPILVQLGVFASFFLPQTWQRAPLSTQCLLTTSVLEVAYVIVFLGVGQLMVRLARRISEVRLALSILFQILLLTLGCALPLAIEMSLDRGMVRGYSLLHITNPFWTLMHVGAGGSLPTDGELIVALVSGTAVLVFALNLPGVIREVRYQRVAAPQRVAEEDAQLEALRHPPQPIQISPWDQIMPPGPQM